MNTLILIATCLISMGCISKKHNNTFAYEPPVDEAAAQREVVIPQYYLFTPPACNDGLDNDHDELIDGDDPGCDDGEDTDEASVIIVPPNVEPFVG